MLAAPKKISKYSLLLGREVREYGRDRWQPLTIGLKAERTRGLPLTRGIQHLQCSLSWLAYYDLQQPA